MQIRNKEIFKIQADLCKVMASATRLMIIDMLKKREVSVGEIAETLEASPATISQHLRLLRNHHIVTTRKEGQTVYYSLAIPRMTEACHIIREVLLDNLKKRGAIAMDLTADNLIEDTQETST